MKKNYYICTQNKYVLNILRHLNLTLMNKIYVSFSSYIAKVLREDLASGKEPIDIPPYITVESFWKKRYPLMGGRQLRKQPSLRQLFISSLRTEKEDFIPYHLAYSEEEYKDFPESEDKKNELIEFAIPKVLTVGGNAVVSNSRVLMDNNGGRLFRQAAIFHFYDLLSLFLHSLQLDCLKAKKPFSIREGIRLFADDYDLSSNEHDALYIQYFRKKNSK